MTHDPEESEPEQRESPPLEPVFKAAFSPEVIEPGSPTDSVLKAIRQITGVEPKVQLRDTSDVLPPLLKPKVGESAGRYQIVGEIARGGIGVVHKARDIDLGRDVAVKILGDDHLHRPELAQRFVEEAQIGGQLQHPGIVPVYEMGLQAGKRPFFSMKLLQGETLAALLEARSQPSEDRHRLLNIFEQVCQTVAYAHARGVIHRDLKPANVMVGGFGEVQVIDWGLAKVLAHGGVADEKALRTKSAASSVDTVRSSEDGSKSQSGTVMGTPAYMPPEQARGEIELLDERSDVFGLGAILCQILTGLPPFPGTNSDSIQKRAAEGDLSDAFTSLENCEADEELVRIAKSALAPEKTDRPRNAGLVAKQMADYLASMEEKARAAEVDAAESRVRVAGERRARRLTMALAASIVVALGGYFWMDQARQERIRETGARVEGLLARATTQFEHAQTEGHLVAYTNALASAERAELAAQAGDADPATKQRIEDLLAELRPRVSGVRDRAMRAQTEGRLRTALEHARYQHAAEFAEAFRQYGVDVDLLPVEEAARELRDRGIPTDLVAYLDSWALDRLKGRTEMSSEWGRLIEVALLVDEDPIRTELRRAIHRRDRAELEEFAQSVSVDETPAPSLHLLGQGLLGAGANEAAVEFLERVQRKHPSDYLINRTLARSLEGTDPPRWSEAVIFRSIANAARSWDWHTFVDLSIALERAGEPEKARLALEAGLAMENQDCYVYLGSRLTEDLGDPERGLEALEKALEADPENAEACHAYGFALSELNKLEEALTHYQKAAELDPQQARYHSDIGAMLNRLGRTAEAETAYRTGIGLNPNDYLLRYNLGQFLYHAMELYGGAETHLRRSIELNPHFAGSHSHLGEVLRETDRLDEALVEHNRALELMPEEPEYHNQLGLTYQRRGDHEAALQAFRDARERDPEASAYLINSWKALIDLNRVFEAVQLLQELQEANPEDAQALHEVAGAVSEKGEFFAAIEILRKAIQLDPELRCAHCDLAMNLRNIGNLDEAETHARRAFEIDPQHAAAYAKLGDIHGARGDLEQALESYQRAAELEPENSSFLNNVGWALRLLNRYDEALDSLHRALELEQNDYMIHYNLGVSYQGKGEYGKGLEHMRRQEELLRGVNPAEHTVAVQDLREAERFVDLDARLPAVLRGEETPTDGSEWMGFAKMAYMKQLHAASARFWKAAFGTDPGLLEDWTLFHAYDAACAAALAGCGQGEDADTLNASERATWRMQAITWLRSYLEPWRTALAAGRSIDALQNIVPHSLIDPDLSGVRDEAALGELPEPERDAAQSLWAEIRALQEEIRG